MKAAGKHPMKLLDTPAEIWETVTKVGGLDLSFHGDMDENFADSLLRSLGVPGAETVDDALRDPTVTVERFMGALLEALNPFSMMLSELLALFELAGATRTDRSLRVAFDFGKAPRLSFDLHQFRDWIENLRRVRTLVTVRRWSYEDLWNLSRVLHIADNGSDLMGCVGTPAEPWAAVYMQDRRWPTFELPRPTNDNKELQVALDRCFQVWQTVVQESSRFGPHRDTLRERGRGVDERDSDEDGGWSPRFLAQVDSDHWAASVAAGMHRIAARIISLDPPNRQPFIDERIRKITELFARVPTMEIEKEQVLVVLTAFLNLPIWQRRHELYSAWIFALIADALDDSQLRFHHEDGLLSFSFKGSHLATAEATFPRLHLWAELRSPLEKPSLLSGRKHIQPDYTLVTDPITNATSSVVVVECKQYRKFSRANFSKAVIDYANGRPRAQIILAAYGPVRDDFLHEVSDEISRRITLISHLRPQSEPSRSRFRRAVRDAIRQRFSQNDATVHPEQVPVVTSPAIIVRSVRLSWGSAPRDLDLHLAIRHQGALTSVGYSNKGSLTAFPWAELNADVTTGHGPETIHIEKLLGANYHFLVVNYSNDATLSNSQAEVVIEQPDSCVRIECPRAGTGQFWHVFNLRVDAGHIEVVNSISEMESFGSDT